MIFNCKSRKLGRQKIFDYKNMMHKIKNKSIVHYDGFFLENYSIFLIKGNIHKDIICSFFILF